VTEGIAAGRFGSVALSCGPRRSVSPDCAAGGSTIDCTSTVAAAGEPQALARR
jgi:hypothetical protein